MREQFRLLQNKKRNFSSTLTLSLALCHICFVFVRVVLHSKTNVSNVNEYLFISALNRFVAPSSVRWLVCKCLCVCLWFFLPFFLPSHCFFFPFHFYSLNNLHIFKAVCLRIRCVGNNHHNTFNSLLHLLGCECFIVIIATAATVDVFASAWNLFLF